MRRVDFVVTVCSDEQEVLRFGLDQDVLHQIKRGLVEPLQIVEEQRQRMLGLGEYLDQPAQRHLYAGLRGRWRYVRNRRLFADHELQLGNEVNDQSAVRIQRPTQLLSPLGELGLGLGQELPAQTSKGLSHSGVRN